MRLRGFCFRAAFGFKMPGLRVPLVCGKLEGPEQVAANHNLHFSRLTCMSLHAIALRRIVLNVHVKLGCNCLGSPSVTWDWKLKARSRHLRWGCKHVSYSSTNSMYNVQEHDRCEYAHFKSRSVPYSTNGGACHALGSGSGSGTDRSAHKFQAVYDDIAAAHWRLSLNAVIGFTSKLDFAGSSGEEFKILSVFFSMSFPCPDVCVAYHCHAALSATLNSNGEAKVQHGHLPCLVV